MVIVVEEEKINQISPLRIGAWIVFLVLIGIGTYYVFFEQPKLIDVGGANLPQLRDVERVKRTVGTEEVEKHPLIQGKNLIQLPTGATFGKPNPFTPVP